MTTIEDFVRLLSARQLEGKPTKRAVLSFWSMGDIRCAVAVATGVLMTDLPTVPTRDDGYCGNLFGVELYMSPDWSMDGERSIRFLDD